MRHLVALILALSVLAFVVVGMAIPLIVRLKIEGNYTPSIEMLEMWKEIVAIIVGGLIAYIAGRDEK